MRLALAAALLLAPVAAGAAFFDLGAPATEATPCGDGACVALLPGEAAVRVAPGHAYSFLGADGAPLAEGTSCDGAPVSVPDGALLLRLAPRAC